MHAGEGELRPPYEFQKPSEGSLELLRRLKAKQKRAAGRKGEDGRAEAQDGKGDVGIEAKATDADGDVVSLPQTPDGELQDCGINGSSPDRIKDQPRCPLASSEENGYHPRQILHYACQ